VRENISIFDAARILGIAPVTLRRWIRQRRLPHVRLGRRVVVQPEDLEAFVQRHRIAAEPTP